MRPPSSLARPFQKLALTLALSNRSLDLSFNLLRSVAPLDDASPDSPFALKHLTHLYLIQNKLTKIEGVRHRDSLTYLEYGGNRIRVRRRARPSPSFSAPSRR